MEAGSKIPAFFYKYFRMINHWIEQANAITENEVILVKQSPGTDEWFRRMPSRLAAICPLEKKLTKPEDFSPKVGYAYYLKLSKWGIEGVLHMPKKYHRYSFHVLYDKANHPQEPFWIIINKI